MKLSHALYANLAIEGELAVRLGDDAEIARIFPIIELHNYVFRSEAPNLQELIANNGLHAGAVLAATEGAQWCYEETVGDVSREVSSEEVPTEMPDGEANP